VPPASLFPSSLFNSDVQHWSLASESAEFARDIVADYKADYGAVGIGQVPIYGVPADQPEVSVLRSSGCKDFTTDTGEKVPIPSYVSLSGSSDSPLIIYQLSTESDWELWQVSRGHTNSYSACWGGELNMASSDGIFPWPYGLSGTGISYLATTITEADIDAGSIDHAIALSIPACNWWVYPADRGDCGSDPGQPSEGQWFRFPSSLAMPTGLSPFAKMVFRAIQTYGLVVVDQGGAVIIAAEQRSDWSAEGHHGTDPITASWDGLQEYQVVANLPWPDLQAVNPPKAPMAS
jgi:hypothetical protein